MSRSGTKKQNTTFNESQGVFNTANQNSNSLYNTLSGVYGQEANDPANSPLFGELNTASQQSTGGSVAAAKGAAGLAAARTGNRGGFQTALDESVRNAQRTNSKNALNSLLGVSEEGMQGLQNLYGTNVNQTMASLGLGGNIANNQASQPGWFQNTLGLINALKPGGSVGSFTFGGGRQG